MTTHTQDTRPSARDAYEPLTPVERLEEEASVATLAAGEALRGIEVAGLVLLGLLLCPPLAILAVLVVVPVAVMALVVGLVVAVLSAPYLLVHHFRGHERHHLPLLAGRLRHAGHALLDLAPHRIVADARKLHPHR